VLDNARPGQRILLTSYGSGAGSDSFDITVTDEIINVQKKANTVEQYINKRQYVDYNTYLKNMKSR
jgi:hydroxymethylglutaryl-CoA synthase